jgi:hypothetical protein
MSVEIIVPWRTDDEPWRETAWNWCQARWMTLFPEWPIVTADDGASEGSFVVPRALNRAVEASSAEILVVVGADTVLRSGSVLEAVDIAREGRWVMMADTMHRCDRLDTERVLGEDPTVDGFARLGRRRVCQLGWGPLCAPRAMLLERLWDERFTAGGEDDAFGVAAQTLWGDPARVVRSPAWLLWHPSPMRSKHPDRDAAVALLGRYKDARWDPAKMRALTMEWQ